MILEMMQALFAPNTITTTESVRPPKDGVYITIAGHPPRPDQTEFKEYIRQNLQNGYIVFKVKGLRFGVSYQDVAKGFVPPPTQESLIRQCSNSIRRSIRHSKSAPRWIKGLATHKVSHGFAMARVIVFADNPLEKAEEWLEYFAGSAKNIFPEEIPMKSFKLLVSPMDLYPQVLKFSKSQRRSAS